MVILGTASYGNKEIVKHLLQRGADPNLQDDFGYTPISIASMRGHLDIIELLLHHHADPNIKDKSGLAPLDHVIKTGHVRIKELLEARMKDDQKPMITSPPVPKPRKTRPPSPSPSTNVRPKPPLPPKPQYLQQKKEALQHQAGTLQPSLPSNTKKPTIGPKPDMSKFSGMKKQIAGIREDMAKVMAEKNSTPSAPPTSYPTHPKPMTPPKPTRYK